MLAIVTTSAEETRIVGASLAPVLLPGDVVSLSGDLGAGKTVLVQGLVGALGVPGPIPSPTFTIMHNYDGRFPVVHMDVYRLDSFQEVLDLGFEELVDPEAILIVEWGEAVAPLLPRRYLEVDIRHPPDLDDLERRVVVFRAHGPEWDPKLASMRTAADALLDAASPEMSVGSRFFDAPGPQARDHKGAPAHPDEEA